MPQIPKAHVGVLEANRVEEESTKDAEHSSQDRNWNASPRPCTVVAFTTAAFLFLFQGSSSQQLGWVGTSAKNHLTCMAFSPTDTTKGANDSTHWKRCGPASRTLLRANETHAYALRTQHPLVARDATVWRPKRRVLEPEEEKDLFSNKGGSTLSEVFSVLVLDEQQLSHPLTALTAPILHR